MHGSSQVVGVLMSPCGRPCPIYALCGLFPGLLPHRLPVNTKEYQWHHCSEPRVSGKWILTQESISFNYWYLSEKLLAALTHGLEVNKWTCSVLLLLFLLICAGVPQSNSQHCHIRAKMSQFTIRSKEKTAIEGFIFFWKTVCLHRPNSFFRVMENTFMYFVLLQIVHGNLLMVLNWLYNLVTCTYKYN